MAATLYIQGDEFMIWNDLERGQISKKEICKNFLSIIESESEKYSKKSKEWIKQNFWNGPYGVFEAEKKISRIKESYNLKWHLKQRHDKYPTFLDFFSDSRNTSIIYK